MRKPWIAIPTGYDSDNNRYGQDRQYLDAIQAAGGVPLLVPVMCDPDQIGRYAEAMDGLILPGSSTDIDPALYRTLPSAKLGRIFQERDRLDLTLLDIAETRQVPVLGICYGAQSLSVFRGGTLVQDIPSEVPGAVEHNREGRPREIKSHSVAINRGSRLERVLNTRHAEVNSYHHQAVSKPGRDLSIVALAPDGVVEAIEDPRERFVLGVQWHPETGWSSDPLSRALFAALVESAIIQTSS